MTPGGMKWNQSVYKIMFIKNGKWDWPIAKKIADVYREHGLIKCILYIILIILGIKLVVINAIIFVLNLLPWFDIQYAPILRSIGLIG